MARVRVYCIVTAGEGERGGEEEGSTALHGGDGFGREPECTGDTGSH